MINDFQILSKLGEGAYSGVYKVKRMSDSQEYALKRVKLLDLNEKEKENALNEIRIIASIRHPNVVCYKEAFWENNSSSLCIIMEYCNDGDLFQKICQYKKKGVYMDEKEIWNVLIQVLKGLKALHDMKIFHRDLKSANFFLNKNGGVKIGDMNVSKVAKKGLLYTQTGTPYYASPEVWMDKPYDAKSDIWSLGCVIYEMVTLKPPFRAEDMDGLYKKVIKGAYQKLPSHFSVDLNNILKMMLQVKPSHRASCDRLLNLPFVIKRLQERPIQVSEDELKNDLLQTIRCPQNLHYLTEKLPEPNYEPIKTRISVTADFQSNNIGLNKGPSMSMSRENSQLDSSWKLKQKQMNGNMDLIDKSRAILQKRPQVGNYERSINHSQIYNTRKQNQSKIQSQQRKYDDIINKTKNRNQNQEIKKKIELLLGKNKEGPKKDYMKIYGVGINGGNVNSQSLAAKPRLEPLGGKRAIHGHQISSLQPKNKKLPKIS